MTEEHAVDVKFKDFSWSVAPQFRASRISVNFLKGLVEGQKIVASHLHGQRRATAAFFPCEHQFRYGPQQTQRFDAAVLKTIVLGNQQGVYKLCGSAQIAAVSFLPPIDQSVRRPAEHAHRGAQRNVTQRLLRQVGAQVETGQPSTTPQRSQQGAVEQQWSAFDTGILREVRFGVLRRLNSNVQQRSCPIPQRYQGFCGDFIQLRS